MNIERVIVDDAFVRDGLAFCQLTKQKSNKYIFCSKLSSRRELCWIEYGLKKKARIGNIAREWVKQKWEESRGRTQAVVSPLLVLRSLRPPLLPLLLLFILDATSSGVVAFTLVHSRTVDYRTDGYVREHTDDRRSTVDRPVRLARWTRCVFIYIFILTKWLNCQFLYHNIYYSSSTISSECIYWQ